jgi:peptidoglycan/LPS O-acetylase OafA/YrhL
MRALAVLGIVAFHAGVAPYGGGFVTLDVFFVVSGFLITLLLLREVERTGRISLLDFYVRRARRILPAAAVVAVCVVGAATLWLGVVDARDAAVDAVWASLFAANVRFALEETDYFTATDPASPLQHYWSLSVEEQFYLVLPLVLVGCVWWAARRSARPWRAITGVLVVVSAASLAWSVHASTASPESAYFSTFTRTWEFGVGALLAVAASRLTRIAPWVRNLMAATGLTMIVVACFVVTTATPFPGYAALLPVLGTGAVMLAGAGTAVDERPALAQRALGVAPLRWIGDASYSIYLWHWPVLVIAEQHLGRDLSPRGLVAALLVTALLSALTYRFVEQPFRRGFRARPARALSLYPASVAMVVAASCVAVLYVQQVVDTDAPPVTTGDYARGPDGRPLSKDPAVALVQASVRAALDGRRTPADLKPALLDLRRDRADVGDCDYRAAPWSLCARGDTDAERSIVLMGNSHARHWAPAVDTIGEQYGFTVYHLVKSACTPARLAMVRVGESEPWRECMDFNAWTTEQVAEIRPALVVISGSAPPRVQVGDEITGDRETMTAQVQRGYARAIREVAPHAGRVVVLGDVPKRRTAPATCLGRSQPSRLSDCLDRPDPRPQRVTAATRRAAERNGATFVGTERWFCAAGRCPAVVGRTITMRDQGHVTTVYARRLTEPLARALGVRRR